MALHVCDPQVDFVWSIPALGGSGDADMPGDVCTSVGGTRSGHVCTGEDGQKYQIVQNCQTDEYPEGFLGSPFTVDEVTSPAVMCTASAPCNFTLSDSQWSQAMDWLGVALVIAYLFAFFHGYGVGDART